MSAHIDRRIPLEKPVTGDVFDARRMERVDNLDRLFKLSQLLFDFGLRDAVNDEHIDHVIGQQLTRIADVDCSLLFVTRQHPNLDARHLQVRNRLGNAVLQLILDGRHADKSHITFNLLVDCFKFVFAAIRSDSRFLLLSAPPIEEILFDYSFRQDERSKSFASEFLIKY